MKQVNYLAETDIAAIVSFGKTCTIYQIRRKLYHKIRLSFLEKSSNFSTKNKQKNLAKYLPPICISKAIILPSLLFPFCKQDRDQNPKNIMQWKAEGLYSITLKKELFYSLQ